MDYFFIDPKDIHGNVANLRGEEYKHLSRVVRKREGEHVVLVDGADTAHEAVIRLIDRNHAELEILGTQHRVNEPQIDITLAVSLLRNPARFDFLVEKATELGVRTIVPLLCERTVPKGEKRSRLEKIALSALKQCGRSFLPRIRPLTGFGTLLEGAHVYSLRLLPHEKVGETQFIGSVLKDTSGLRSVLIVVGPEGGFTDAEVALSGEKGFVPVSLGPRRLRAETAAISALSWVVGGE
jgi:16S rRNA (uracil1498-N3)-methyltransferase